MSCETLSEWQALPAKKKVEQIIESMDEARFGTQGGYPSQYEIRWGHVIHATVDHEGAPDLTVLPVAEWIAKYEDCITDFLEIDDE